MNIDLNTDSFVVLANKLEKIHRAALPNAIRGTLNSLAFDVKTNTMLKHSKKEFTNRQRNFFRVASKVQTAKGFDVNSMEATVGFKSFSQSSEFAINDLKFQEKGGVIKDREFIPLEKARTSSSIKKSVRKKSRLGSIRNVVRVDKTEGSNKGQKFIHAVNEAGVGGHIMTENALFLVKRISKSGGKFTFKLDAIYSFKKNRSVRVKATHFMRNSAKETSKKTVAIFNKEAVRQIKKYTDR